MWILKSWGNRGQQQYLIARRNKNAPNGIGIMFKDKAKIV